MSLEQARFIELLEDPTFRKFVVTKPDLPPAASIGGRLPWRLWVQREAGGRWAKKDFTSYGEAARALKSYLKTAHDLALGSRSVAFKIPGRWVNLSKGGQPVYLRDAKNQIVVRDGVKVRKQKFVAMSLPPGHAWCIYCRRPTVFTWFSRHHAFSKELQDLFRRDEERCTICGITENNPHDWQGR